MLRQQDINSQDMGTVLYETPGCRPSWRAWDNLGQELGQAEQDVMDAVIANVTPLESSVLVRSMIHCPSAFPVKDECTLVPKEDAQKAGCYVSLQL